MNLLATVETVTLVGNVKKWQRFSSEGLLLFLICFHDNASIFLEVLSLKTFSNLLSTMPAFHLDILKIIRPFFLSSNDSLRNEYNKRHFWKFVLKSFAIQLKPRFSLSANNTATDLRYFETGLLYVLNHKNKYNTSGS